MVKTIETCKRHFNMSFEMLERMFTQCPEELWGLKAGGFVFWQQILHALSGTNYWMRSKDEPFDEPFADRKVYPELEADPEGEVTREELIAYKEKVKKIAARFFEGKDDIWLLSSSWIFGKMTNLDVVLGQIRHLQYHVGHCNSILRQLDLEAVEWIDLFAE